MKSQAITLGRVGILLPVAAIIPVIGFLAGLAALVLLLISHYYFSKVYEKPVIFNSALTGTIVQVGANLIGGIVIAIAVGTTAVSLSLQDPETFDIPELTSVIFGSGVTIAGTIILLAGAIVALYFIYKALSNLAGQSGVNLFKTAGLLYFIGAIALVIGIGALVIFAAWIVHIIAYFSIPYETESAAAQS
ncbi:MAG: DUF996 domain-containing protein [Bacteroidales bacterium]|nr:DUF996 domain-containing protein [Bacteroidales bacterium]